MLPADRSGTRVAGLISMRVFVPLAFNDRRGIFACQGDEVPLPNLKHFHDARARWVEKGSPELSELSSTPRTTRFISQIYSPHSRRPGRFGDVDFRATYNGP